jgi:hypothetical protein
LIFPKTTVKLEKLEPIGVIVNAKLVKVQLPKEGLQLVLLSELNYEGAVMINDVKLVEKEGLIANGELIISVMLEF